MKKTLFFLLLYASIAAFSGTEKLPTSINKEGVSLMLNGQGIREKFWIDLYHGGLYLPSKSNDAKEIISKDAPMAIYLHIVSGLIDAKKMNNAIDEGFEKSTRNNTATLAKEITAFRQTFDTEIALQDTYLFLYLPNKGTSIYKNDTYLRTIEGLNFKKALFGIWLCDDPADETLKKRMLGE